MCFSRRVQRGLCRVMWMCWKGLRRVRVCLRREGLVGGEGVDLGLVVVPIVAVGLYSGWLGIVDVQLVRQDGSWHHRTLG
jgi:hypothetical protein